MLYYLFTWLDKEFDFPGAGVFQYISFRASMSIIFSLLFTTIYGNRLIRILRAKQVGETVRNLIRPVTLNQSTVEMKCVRAIGHVYSAEGPGIFWNPDELTT